jgi:hypothetical protein
MCSWWWRNKFLPEGWKLVMHIAVFGKFATRNLGIFASSELESFTFELIFIAELKSNTFAPDAPRVT